MSAESVCPAYALAHVGADVLAQLSPIERLVLRHRADVWLRPEQRLPDGKWRSVGFIAGRGFGKTHGIAHYVNRGVETRRIRSLGLAAPSTDRVYEVQIKNLIEMAAPWFRPRYVNRTIVWPNGLEAEVFTPEEPGRPRSSNLDFAWLTELVDWQETTRSELFNNLTTAVRVGLAQYAWDTTEKGANDVIEALKRAHAADPARNILRNGYMFDNPLHGQTYLESEVAKYKGRQFEEEILGRSGQDASGAFWSSAQLDETRVEIRPAGAPLTLVALDPALADGAGNDEFGIVIGDRGRDGHAYVHADESGKYSPEGWGHRVVDWCHSKGAAGVVLERNHAGDNPAYVIRSIAKERGMRTEILPLRDGAGRQPKFPPRKPGVIYIREVTAASSKGSRASGPAVEYAQGRGHIVGHLSELETQLTRYVPGSTRKSPNRFDAHNYLITELAGLEHDAPSSNQRETARQAGAAHAALMKTLESAALGRRVGL